MRKKGWLVALLLCIVIMLAACVGVENKLVFGMTNSVMGENRKEQVNSLTTYKSVNSNLAAGILALTKKDQGTQYAVFVAYPKQFNEAYLYHSKPMRSASMIKVFILATAMERVKTGTLSLEQTVSLKASDKVGGAGVLQDYPTGKQLSLDTIMRLMITESDNTATNMMIDLLGMNAINAYCKENGYTDTYLARKMMDNVAVQEGRENYPSVKDLGTFFVRLYNNKLVSPELDGIMLSYFKGQTDKECFPAALPGVVIAHKTGELDGLYDDGGIIYDKRQPVIMVVMTDHFSSRSKAIDILKQMAQVAVKNNSNCISRLFLEKDGGNFISD